MQSIKNIVIKHLKKYTLIKMIKNLHGLVVTFSASYIITLNCLYKLWIHLRNIFLVSVKIMDFTFVKTTRKWFMLPWPTNSV